MKIRNSAFYKVHQQKGAALLAVLIIALVLVILMSVAAQTMQNRLTLASNSKQHLEASAAVQAKISELMYLLVTQRVTVAGISQGKALRTNIDRENANFDISPLGDELRVDGFTYQLENGGEFSIQNENGLIPINSSGQYWLKRWLKGYGYSVIEQANYADRLADYADPDNWRRPGGAELASYEEQGIAAPANFLLQSCNELWKVINWPSLLKQHSDMLLQCSLGRGDTLHLNAIPLDLWQILWPNSALKVSEERKQGKWLLTDSDILALEPSLLLLGENYISPFGGRKYRLKANRHNSSQNVNIEVGIGLLIPFTARQLAVSN